MYRFNPQVDAVSPSPVAEAQSWLAGRRFCADKPLLDVAQAVPGYPPPAELRRYLADQIDTPQSAFYTGIFGLPALREALAEHMTAEYRPGAAIDAGQVAIVAGCNQGFCAAVTALAAPGDEIILPLPYYFNHQMWAAMNGVRVAPLAFDEAGGGLPSIEQAAELVGPRTRAIALVSPNNPTGAVYPPALLAAFYRLARERGIALILDETYKDFGPEPPAHTLFDEPDWPATLIQLYSFSKAYSLTGYRVGSVIAGAELLTQIGKFQDCVAICAPHIGQLAALYGLRHLADWRAEKRRLMQTRAEALRAALARPELRYRTLTLGAYFAYLKHPFSGRPASQVARQLLDRQHLLCLPGTTFGPGQEAYLRLAFANLDTEQMPLLAERLLASQQDVDLQPTDSGLEAGD